MINEIANFVYKKLHNFGIFASLIYEGLVFPFRIKRRRHFLVFLDVLTKQIYFTGVQAIKAVSFIALIIGGIVIIQVLGRFPGLGNEKLIGKVLVIVIIRELAPVITSFVVISRSATAITTELGNMKVSGEFDNLIYLGIDPSVFIFVPRIYGMIFSILALNVFFVFFAVVGGFLVARLISYVHLYSLVKSFIDNLELLDIVIINLKGFLMGLSISIISIKEALKTESSFTEVPQATTRAVVESIFYVLVIDMIFAGLFYL